MLKTNLKIFLYVLLLFTISPIPNECLSYESNYKEIGAIAPEYSIINMCFVDNELALLAEIERGLALYSIINPYNCFELDYQPLSNVHDLELDYERKLAYITSTAGINIFNYSNIYQLDPISVYLNFTSCTYLQLKGELLLIGAEERGLQIINVSDPYHPIMIDNWIDSEGHVGPVYVMNDYAFVGIRIPNISGPPTHIALKLLDISDPKNITYVSTVDTGEGYNGGAPQDHHLDLVYLNDYSNGLKILNASNPNNITVCGTYDDGGSFNDVKIINYEYAFLADDSEGLKVIDCSDPTNSFKIGSYSHQWRTLRVDVKGERVYLGTLGAGTRILTTETIMVGSPIHPILIFCTLLITSFVLIRVVKRKTIKL